MIKTIPLSINYISYYTTHHPPLWLISSIIKYTNIKGNGMRKRNEEKGEGKRERGRGKGRNEEKGEGKRERGKGRNEEKGEGKRERGREKGRNEEKGEGKGMGNKTSGAERYPSGRYLRSQRNYFILKKEERGEELGGDGSQREGGRSTKEVEREEWKKE